MVARSEHCEGCDRVTKNIGNVGARSEQGQNIVTVTKNIGARSEQNVIYDRCSAWDLQLLTFGDSASGVLRSNLF